MNRGRIGDDLPIVLSILVATYLVSKFNKSRLASAIRSNMRLFVSFVVSLLEGTRPYITPHHLLWMVGRDACFYVFSMPCLLCVAPSFMGRMMCRRLIADADGGGLTLLPEAVDRRH